MKLAIIDYGAGNVQSVKFAFNRLGLDPVLTSDKNEILTADKVIFPGVGEASSAMEAIRSCQLEELIPNLKQPVLGVCLGMQLMCKHTEEGNAEGLGIFDVDVKRFEEKLKVPHMGWNTITDLKTPLYTGVKEEEFVYFVHSYYVPMHENTIASCDYVLPYSASLQKDNFYACQFHPEKSGTAGEQILKNFIEL